MTYLDDIKVIISEVVQDLGELQTADSWTMVTLCNIRLQLLSAKLDLEKVQRNGVWITEDK